MTLREDMKLRLNDRGLSEAEAEECMRFVIESALGKDYFVEVYDTENCWEWNSSRFTLEDRMFYIFPRFVLDAAFKWSINRFNNQKAALQEIHRLSSPPTEQGKAE